MTSKIISIGIARPRIKYPKASERDLWELISVRNPRVKIHSTVRKYSLSSYTAIYIEKGPEVRKCDFFFQISIEKKNDHGERETT